jgi:hypothetical protein
MAMQTKGGVAKKATKPFGKKSKDSPAGPGAMPHTGKKDCRCPGCKDRKK